MVFFFIGLLGDLEFLFWGGVGIGRDFWVWFFRIVGSDGFGFLFLIEVLFLLVLFSEKYFCVLRFFNFVLKVVFGFVVFLLFRRFLLECEYF